MIAVVNETQVTHGATGQESRHRRIMRDDRFEHHANLKDEMDPLIILQELRFTYDLGCMPT
jgi:hypothetical protein